MFYLEQNMMSFMCGCYHHYVTLQKQTMIIEFPTEPDLWKRIQKIDHYHEEEPF